MPELGDIVILRLPSIDRSIILFASDHWGSYHRSMGEENVIQWKEQQKSTRQQTDYTLGSKHTAALWHN